MIITSVVIIAIVLSSFAFNAKRIGTFCMSADITSTTCNTVNTTPLKRVPGINNRYYVVDWDGSLCDATHTHFCTTSAFFALD